MFLLDRMFVGGLKFVLQRVADAVDTEMNDVERLREELLAAQMRLELGEIGEDEFAGLEADLLARMRVIEAARRAAASEARGGEDAMAEVDAGIGPTLAGAVLTVETSFDAEPDAAPEPEALHGPRGTRRRR